MEKFYYEVHEGNGPYLLMIHGMLSSRAQWTRNLAALSTGDPPGGAGIMGTWALSQPRRSRPLRARGDGRTA